MLQAWDKQAPALLNADVYEDDNWSSIASSIEISGNLKKTLFSTSFVGTFAIEYYEPTCRDGVQAKIDWQDGYQNISFYYAGDFSRFDVKMIDIQTLCSFPCFCPCRPKQGKLFTPRRLPYPAVGRRYAWPPLWRGKRSRLGTACVTVSFTA